MRKWTLPAIALALIALTMAIKHINASNSPFEDSPLTVTSGHLSHIDLYSPQLGDTMKIDVWTPSGYSRDMKYPVIYLHDGQNLFDASSTWNHQAWEIDSVASQLINDGSIPPAIFVGIYSTDSTRLGDLMPERPLQYLKNDTIKQIIATMCRDNYRADEYLKFITTTLRHTINTHYASDTTATYIMGSSMGGLISIYALGEYPHIFAGAACLSTHWTGALGSNDDFPRAMRHYLGENLMQGSHHKIYLDNGDCPYDSIYTPHLLQIVDLIESLGYGNRLQWAIYRGHAHNEQSWARRVANPLKFLLNNQ